MVEELKLGRELFQVLLAVGVDPGDIGFEDLASFRRHSIELGLRRLGETKLA